MLAGAAAARVVAVDGLALRVRYELAVGNQVILLLDALHAHEHRHADAPYQEADDGGRHDAPIPLGYAGDGGYDSHDRDGQTSPAEGDHLLVVVRDCFFHGFHVSFDQFVDGYVEENAEQQQAFHIGIGLVVLPA